MNNTLDWNNPAFVESQYLLNTSSLQRASLLLQNNSQFILRLIQQNGNGLRDCMFQDDPIIVQAAVSKHATAFKFASTRLRDNKAIAAIAVAKAPLSALKYCSERLRGDKELMTVAIKRNGKALQYASDTLRNDRDLVRMAVKQNSSALKHASNAIQTDRMFVSTLQFDRTIEIDQDEEQKEQNNPSPRP